MNLGIIAAGEGSRMRAEGFALPKPLVSISGRPLIDRIIDAGVHAGVSRIACIVNEQSPELVDHLRRKSTDAEIALLVRSTPSSMHSLFALAPLLGDGDFCLATADTVFQEEEFMQFLMYAGQIQNTDGLLAVTQFVDDEKPLYAAMDDERRIVNFSDTLEGTHWVTGGVYYFSSRIFAEIETAYRRRIERLRNFLRLLLEKGYRLAGYPFSKMIDVDHVHDVSVAEEFLRNQNQG